MNGAEISALALLVLLFVTAALFRSRMGCGFQVAFLIRFQLMLICSPLLILAASFFVEDVFGNLLIVGWFHQAFFVSWIGFSSAWLCLAMTTTVLDHTGDRFGVDYQPPTGFWAWSARLFTIPPLLLMIALLLESTWSKHESSRAAMASTALRVGLGLVAGFVAAWVSAKIVERVFRFLEQTDGHNGAPSSGASTPIQAHVEHVAEAPRQFIFAVADHPKTKSPAEKSGRIGDWLKRLSWLSEWLGPGYFRPEPDGRVYSEHLVELAAAIFGLIAYVAIFFWGWSRLRHHAGSTGIPALAYLEALFLFLVMGLSAVSFYLDRWRIPVVLTVAVYSFLGSQFFDTDHFWLATRPATSSAAAAVGGTEPSPEDQLPDGLDSFLAAQSRQGAKEVLRTGGGKPVLIVVCASGGGIEAAAWTAKVLTGLQAALGQSFTRSIRLISSTSGGSVGSLFFVQSMYQAKDAPADSQLPKILTASEKQSLDAVGWGLAEVDFARLMLPWLRSIGLWLSPREAYGDEARELDRSWALEQAWNSALADPKNPNGIIDTKLSDWSGRVKEGLLPGTVFNATLVETGNPLLLSTINVPEPQPSNVVIFGQSGDRGGDLSTVTAARLSATFPYVSPVARGHYPGDNRDTQPPVWGLHVADGGYYDNYGTTMAAEWIKDAFQRHREEIGKVIIISIDAFPEKFDGDPAPPPDPNTKKRPDRAPWMNPNSGWGSEILGPIKTVVNARSATQLGRDVIELDLLKMLNGLAKPADKAPGAESKSGTASPDANSAASDLDCEDSVIRVPFVAEHVGPLSWQLSQPQIAQIDCDWKCADIQKHVSDLSKCLGLAAPHDVAPCPETGTVAVCPNSNQAH